MAPGEAARCRDVSDLDCPRVVELQIRGGVVVDVNARDVLEPVHHLDQLLAPRIVDAHPREGRLEARMRLDRLDEGKGVSTARLSGDN